MSQFHYNAIDADGKPTFGEIVASSIADATQLLESQGLRVESVKLIETNDGGSEKRPTALQPRDFQFLGERIADLTRAELPLVSGLAALSQELPVGRLRRGLNEIVRQLESGKDLESVLNTHGAPVELQALIRSGIRTGHVSEVLAQYISHVRSLGNLKLSAMMAFGYPIIMFLLALAVTFFTLIYVVPNFKTIFEDFDTELPGLTEMLIGISDFLVGFGWWLILGTIVGGVAVVAVIKVASGDVGFQRFIRMIPLIGSLLHWSAMSRLCHLLAVLIDNKVPLSEALILAGDGVGNAGIRSACRTLAHHTSLGEPLFPGHHLLSGFPASFIQTLAQQNQTEALPEALHAIADMFEGRTRLQSNFITAVCGPVIMIFICGMLGTVVIALFLPLLKMINALS